MHEREMEQMTVCALKQMNKEHVCACACVFVCTFAFTSELAAALACI